MVVIDTHIIIDQLRRPQGTESALINIINRESEKNIAMSVISVQELFEGQSSQDQVKQQILLGTISPLMMLPYTFEVAQLAGEIIRDNNRDISFADAAIAATVIANGFQLYTLNTKDFEHINNLELYITGK